MISSINEGFYEQYRNYNMGKIDYREISEALLRVAFWGNHKKKFYKYSSVYPFTTENLTGTFNNFDFKDKRVLTVCGSGDHILNAILFGAKSVDSFDISIYPYMYFNLKKAAIKALSYEEFIEYFYLRNGFSEEKDKFPNAMNIKYYWKISQYLDPHTKFFWDSLYLEFDGFEIRTSELFSDDIGLEKEVILSNPYLDKENYYKLRNMIDKCLVRFINTDVKELKNKTKKSYDFIHLSNIASYISFCEDTEVNEMEKLYKYKEMVMELSKSLNDNGIIVVAYLYKDSDSEYYSKRWPYIDRLYARKKVFDENEFSCIRFTSIWELMRLSKYKDLEYNNSDVKDAVLVYKKK